ncbi:hypothetical protein [Oryzobacter telluris]|uniref:hypothetical protein n=1 Tax=Oryzobacter telluris TaxID=3149179 RepID=UPI00370D7992
MTTKLTSRMTTRAVRRADAPDRRAGVIGICLVTAALLVAVVALGIVPVLF